MILMSSFDQKRTFALRQLAVERNTAGTARYREDANYAIPASDLFFNATTFDEIFNAPSTEKLE